MAEQLFKEHLYSSLLAPTPGYSVSFALGMTYSLSFEALLAAQFDLGMLGEVNEEIMKSPKILLGTIAKSSDKVVVFCNKGGIAVPPSIRKVYSLMERNIFEVFDRNNIKANFHPKLWLIREQNNDDEGDCLLKLIVTSRNLAYSDNIDCVVCLTGKVGPSSVKNAKHRPLIAFIEEVIKLTNISKEQENAVKGLLKDLERVRKFDVETPFEDYDFYPYLFNKDFGLGNVTDYLVGTDSIIVSPFIDERMLSRLNPANKSNRVLITRKEYVSKKVFDGFKNKGGIYVTIDELASHGMDLHAKMYHVWYGRDQQYLFLGSANATTSAFERNGEFLIRLKYKYGNIRSAQFLREFYEEGNRESKFMPLAEPMEHASTIEWTQAETDMKSLMCADDLTAQITHHHTGDYSVTVTSSLKKLKEEVTIAPLQRKDLAVSWTGRVVFTGMKADELSEFYILSSTSDDGICHKAVVKIQTSGMPLTRNQAIFQNIIKTKADFYQFLELMLTDTPVQYISTEIMKKLQKETEQETSQEFPSLYEKMLRVAATNPAQLKEIGKMVDRLGAEVVPNEFKEVYNKFLSVLEV